MKLIFLKLNIYQCLSFLLMYRPSAIISNQIAALRDSVIKIINANSGNNFSNHLIQVLYFYMKKLRPGEVCDLAWKHYNASNGQ